MKAVLYLRVSTNDQTTANQLPVLEAWDEHRSFEIVDIYQENESAWKAGHQAELKRLIANVRKHKSDVVMVWA